MADNREWVIWNGSLGVVDMADLGRTEDRASGRSAWLAAPYDSVGPFDLDELETRGRIAFGACLVMSRRKWGEDQSELRSEARSRRRDFAMGFAARDIEQDERKILGLPAVGLITAADINSAFRRLAKSHHPDAGGDHESYIRLTEARDALLAAAAPV